MEIFKKNDKEVFQSLTTSIKKFMIFPKNLNKEDLQKLQFTKYKILETILERLRPLDSEKNLESLNDYIYNFHNEICVKELNEQLGMYVLDIIKDADCRISYSSKKLIVSLLSTV